MARGDLDLALQKARELEKAGKRKDAYQAYLRAGAVQDAARLLAAGGKPQDAGRLLLGVLKIDPAEVGTLPSSNRKLAYLAATYFAKDARTAGIAVELFSGLGEDSKAADILEKTGDMVGAERIRASRFSFGTPGRGSMGGPNRSRAPESVVSRSAMNRHAAARLVREGKLELAAKAYVQIKHFGEAGRLLKKLNKPVEAAKAYSEGGMGFEAGECYLEVGELDLALENFVRVQKGDPRYRVAVVRAVVLADKLGILNFQFEHFITDFSESVPRDEKETEAFYILGGLYEKNNLLANAKDAYAKVLTSSPGYRDVPRKLELLGRYTGDSEKVYDRIRDQEASFQGKRVLSDPSAKPEVSKELPPLPEIPDLPPPSQITGLEKAPPHPHSQGVATFDSKADQTANDATIAMYAGESKETNLGFEIGNTIENRYRLDSELGRGGMAVVFAAHDLELEEDVALKVFLQQLLDSTTKEDSLARFKQELKLSRQLNHPNIIRLYDIGLHGTYRYISMELLKGRVLEDLMRGPMDLAKGLSYLVQAAAGLQAVHDKGVVHRDIKPDNIFVTTNDTVKIMDFGIAKNTLGKGLTVEGMTAGTPEYIAPEQISSFSEVTEAADQYALGAIAYRMFTGKLLFDHEELTPLLMMHLNRPPTPPREVNSDIPKELEQLILRLLAKKPEQRFGSCRELADHLRRLGSSVRK